MGVRALWPLLLGAGLAAADETVYLEDFTGFAPERAPFAQTWGDDPASVETNAVVDGAARLRLVFTGRGEKGLSYWTYSLRQPLPLVDGLKRIEVELKTSARVLLKVGMSPFGFIYHSGGVGPSDEFQVLAMDDVSAELQKWVRGGERDPAHGYLSSIILAIQDTTDATVDLTVRRLAVVAADGTGDRLEEEALRREAAAVRVATVSMKWSPEERTVERVVRWIHIARHLGADIVALPQECVATAGEPVPGPISEALAAAARECGLGVVANYRERADGKTYVTSLLFNRHGELVGRYRKSHKLPDEDMDLGDELPVFRTELGTVAMKIGTDRHFLEIDHCYAVQGAGLVFWAQMPEPVEDEHLQDRPIPGTARDYGLTYVCSRYASAEPGWLTQWYPTYPGRPIGRSWVINREGQRIACTPQQGGGVAVATIPVKMLGAGRGRPSVPGFRLLWEDHPMPPRPAYAKRLVRVAAIENHLGIEPLLERLDECGRMACDIVCTYEFVWISGGPAEQVARQTEQAKDNLARISAKAKQYGMYVLVGGVVDRLERNEAILFDRQGNEVWRYFKIVQTHPEQIVGDQVPVYDTDFGRIGVWICADEGHPEIARCLHVLGADLLLSPTQDWGAGGTARNERDISRAMNGGFFHVEATHASTEPLHQSRIIAPDGAIPAQASFNRPGIVSAVIDLDHDRPRRYAREWTPRDVGGYLPEFQADRVPKAYDDLYDVIRQQRRPELYRPILAPPSS